MHINWHVFNQKKEIQVGVHLVQVKLFKETCSYTVKLYEASTSPVFIAEIVEVPTWESASKFGVVIPRIFPGLLNHNGLTLVKLHCLKLQIRQKKYQKEYKTKRGEILMTLLQNQFKQDSGKLFQQNKWWITFDRHTLCHQLVAL